MICEEVVHAREDYSLKITWVEVGETKLLTGDELPEPVEYGECVIQRGMRFTGSQEFEFETLHSCEHHKSVRIKWDAARPDADASNEGG